MVVSKGDTYGKDPDGRENCICGRELLEDEYSGMQNDNNERCTTYETAAISKDCADREGMQPLTTGLSHLSNSVSPVQNSQNTGVVLGIYQG